MQLKQVIYILLCIFPFSVFAQQTEISGTLKNGNGESVAHANVLIKDRVSGKLAYFKSSDGSGKFAFSLPESFSMSDYFIEINHLAYQQLTVDLEENKMQYDVILQDKTYEIKEIKIGNRPKIIREGDTSRYNVVDFASSLDKSIGDVLKRLPGVEVSDDGRITVQGQGISNLYIDGDDLLEGKYGIGTRAIPHAIVQGVEVLRNHQPIKVLKNRVIARNIALNLIIKDKAKLEMTGDATLGAGLPEQYFAEINAMLFNKKHKLLNVLKGNNIGEDLSLDLMDLVSPTRNFSNFLLNSGTVGYPDIPKQRYYRNNSVGLFTHNLVHLKRNWQVKSNIDLVYDRNKFNYENRSSIFTSTDSIVFTENLNQTNQFFHFDFIQNIYKNVEEYYLKNILSFQFNTNPSDALLIQPNSESRQFLEQKIYKLSNDFRYIPLLKNKDVLSITWNLEGSNQPESLRFDDQPVMLNQDLQVKSLSNQVDVEYALKPGKITQRYSLNSSLNWQSLDSEMDLKKEGQDEIAQNRLKWNESRTKLNGNYSLKRRYMEWSLNLPMIFQSIRYKDPLYDLDQLQTDLLFNPSLFGKLLLSSRTDITLNYGLSNVFSNLFSIYQGTILTNYRTLVANESVLQERKNHRASVSLKTGSPAKMQFLNLSYQFVHSASNTIRAYEVSDDVTRSYLLAMDNKSQRHSFNLGLDKFIFFLGGKSAINFDYSLSNQNQIVNGELLPYESRQFSLNPSINIKLLRQININYRSLFSWYTSEPKLKEVGFPQQVFRSTQNIALYYSPESYIHLGLKGQQLYSDSRMNSSSEYYFFDANIRYKQRKWRTEFELEMSNLANVKTFEYSYLDNNSMFFNSYRLNGRILMLKVNYNF